MGLVEEGAIRRPGGGHGGRPWALAAPDRRGHCPIPDSSRESVGTYLCRRSQGFTQLFSLVQNELGVWDWVGAQGLSSKTASQPDLSF